MEGNIRIFKTTDALAKALANDLEELIGIKEKRDSVTIAVSGGRTPESIFPVLAGKYSGQVNWPQVNIFWVDERTVSIMLALDRARLWALVSMSFTMILSEE